MRISVKRYNELQRRLTSQRQWIEDHGGSESGYIARYGSVSDPQHYGDGGEAIWAADSAALQALVEELS